MRFPAPDDAFYLWWSFRGWDHGTRNENPVSIPEVDLWARDNPSTTDTYQKSVVTTLGHPFASVTPLKWPKRGTPRGTLLHTRASVLPALDSCHDPCLCPSGPRLLWRPVPLSFRP